MQYIMCPHADVDKVVDLAEELGIKMDEAPKKRHNACYYSVVLHVIDPWDYDDMQVWAKTFAKRTGAIFVCWELFEQKVREMHNAL